MNAKNITVGTPANGPDGETSVANNRPSPSNRTQVIEPFSPCLRQFDDQKIKNAAPGTQEPDQNRSTIHRLCAGEIPGSWLS
jgi:hypothetical protein